MRTLLVLAILGIITTACGPGFESLESDFTNSDLLIEEEGYANQLQSAASQRDVTYTDEVSSFTEARAARDKFSQQCREENPGKEVTISAQYSAKNNVWKVTVVCTISDTTAGNTAPPTIIDNSGNQAGGNLGEKTYTAETTTIEEANAKRDEFVKTCKDLNPQGNNSGVSSSITGKDANGKYQVKVTCKIAAGGAPITNVGNNQNSAPAIPIPTIGNNQNVAPPAIQAPTVGNNNQGPAKKCQSQLVSQDLKKVQDLLPGDLGLNIQTLISGVKLDCAKKAEAGKYSFKGRIRFAGDLVAEGRCQYTKQVCN